MTEPPGGLRLDAALAARGLARSRSHAARLVAEGLVTVDGKAATKPALRIRDAQRLEVLRPDHYVSRGARKLAAALDALPIVTEDRLALDVGASTGGFTQVLLERGARRVVALDVGHDQLDPLIRADDRVVVVEGVNARELTGARLADWTGGELPGIVVADLSFIPLGLVLPALLASAGADADYVVLVKPQFEVGRGGIRDGVVRDPALRERALAGVLRSAWELGLPTAGLLSSPVPGSTGNREYLAWFSTSAGVDPTEWREQVLAMARD